MHRSRGSRGFRNQCCLPRPGEHRRYPTEDPAMNTRVYQYVGPREIFDAVSGDSPRYRIASQSDVLRWARDNPSDATTATFVVDSDAILWIADRRSEHVACARRMTVMTAGEITFSFDGDSVSADYITNQSTGYCPEPSSFDAIRNALLAAGIDAPDDFALHCHFRRCDCGQINVIKNGLFECGVCNAVLPLDYNFDAADGG